MNRRVFLSICLVMSAYCMSSCELASICGRDSDEDGINNCDDVCPFHADNEIIDQRKFESMKCDCEDSDGDGIIDCLDVCPYHANLEPTICGCDAEPEGEGIFVVCPETSDVEDKCPNDPNKTAPGVCGCGVSDRLIVWDDDALTEGNPRSECPTAENLDLCPFDPNKNAPGQCGCGVADIDTDGDGVPDCIDECPGDEGKKYPGTCGCGSSDGDSDGDTIIDCQDGCPTDSEKNAPGICGCNVPDIDSDGDNVMDCLDKCPDDPRKQELGVCGCGVEDSAHNLKDTDNDGVVDCADKCPLNPYKISPEPTTCDEKDIDGDGVEDGDDPCPYNPNISKESAEISKVDCNYHKDENGELVYEIYSANDLARLRTEIEKIIPDKQGFLCKDNSFIYSSVYATTCFDENTALRCEKDYHLGNSFWHYAECPECKESTWGYKVDCKNECGKLYINDEGKISLTHQNNACCIEEGFIACQDNNYSAYVCHNGKVESWECESGCSDNVCHHCLIEDGDTLTVGGKTGDCCDYNTYKETCVGDEVLRCSQEGIVYKSKCMTGCSELDENDDNVLCIEGEKSKNLFKIRLMNDIDLADIVPIKNNNVIIGCLGDWTPIDLYRTEFDGNNKEIRFTDDFGNRICAITRPFFNNIIDSDVKNIKLRFELRGAVSSAFAQYVNTSRLSNIYWNGNAYISSALLNESASIYGGLASYVRHSELKHVGVSGTLFATSGIEAFALIGKMDNVVLDMATVDLSYLRSTNKSTSALAGYLLGRNVIGNTKVLVNDFEFGSSEQSNYETVAYGLIASMNRSTLRNIIFDVNNLVKTTGETTYADEQARFDGILGGFPKGAFLNMAWIKVDNFIVEELSSIISWHIEGKLSNLKIQFGTVETGEYWGTIGNINNDVSRVEVSIDKLYCEDELMLLGDIYSDGVTIEDASISVNEIASDGSAYLYGLFGEIFGSKNKPILMSNMQIKLDNVNLGGTLIGDSVQYTTIQKMNVAINGALNWFTFLSFVRENMVFSDISIYMNNNKPIPPKLITEIWSYDSDNPTVFNRIVQSSQFCTDEPVTEAFIGSFSSSDNVDVKDVYWLKENKSYCATDSDDDSFEALFTPFDASQTEGIVKRLGGAWTTSSVTKSCGNAAAKSIEVPSYKVDLTWLDEMNAGFETLKKELEYE